MSGTFDVSVDLLLVMKLVVAAALGAAVGYERSYHGRAAGMRTYAIVSMASAMLLMVHGYPHLWFGADKDANLTDDATRVIQGIVTGIGFLGAGVIIKDGFSIRGLSTAASIWLTSAIGVLVGIGFYVAAAAATLITTLIMSEFKVFEHILPHQLLVRLELTFKRTTEPSLDALRERMAAFGFKITEWSLKADLEAGKIIYVMALKGSGDGCDERLAEGLRQADDILDYLLAPSHS
jgi:putative Mg2+ transporter-C (MgtC) family protein